MTGWAEDNDAIEVRFDSRPSRTVHLLGCADGVGSTARSQLLPEVRPVYAGYVAWRGTVPEAALDERTLLAFDDAITYYVYANSHILVYPIPGSNGSIEPGNRLINFVWYRNYLDGPDLADLLTDSGGHRLGVSGVPLSSSFRRPWKMRSADTGFSSILASNRSTPFALRSGAARHPKIASRGRRDNAAKFSSIARNSPQVSP
jgi:2,6-dihydroxypyridine 3-monooxygenase